jgi:DNA excision repair protein ERCC-3
MSQDKPLIIQSDRTVLLDVHSPEADAARSSLVLFAELEKSPEHIHTYRLTPLSLWNAASAGVDAGAVTGALQRFSRYPVPENVVTDIRETIARFGKLHLRALEGREGMLRLDASDPIVAEELRASTRITRLVEVDGEGFLVPLLHRGTLKQELMRIGYPVKDEAPLEDGERLSIRLREIARSGRPFRPRDYQDEAARAFDGGGRPGAGFGTVVLPCGSGKTVIGLAVMARIGASTLVLAPNVAAVHQWIDEILDKTWVTEDLIGEYSGDRKEVRPITIATYQILIWRGAPQDEFPHFRLFRQRRWGLIVYDEVHLLPAPVFRVTAEIQAVRRLGLTATLVREDGREGDVFTLVGPKRYDVPWKELEGKGWIAVANCVEVRVVLPRSLRLEYALADQRAKFRLASENPLKPAIVRQLAANHAGEGVLVIGQYLSQLDVLAEELDAPLITGKTPNGERERLYAEFRRGALPVLVVSKVANFAIDLPDASVAIQVSGTFGSRQEEAQRLGRILRPKKRNSFFYSLVSRATVEETFAANRQKFLTEQGYRYTIELWDEEELG